MTRISIVIVNYNVKYFIRQCLQSIYKSKISAELEVIVVDNNSQDGSVAMIRNEFESVILIHNAENVGFSKANNQGFQKASGEFVLILNPDTIIEESTLEVCLDYYKSHNDIGAIGVKMLDGSGQFLPESKRGFPTPMASLSKILGFSKVFDKSSIFNSYYMGHLSNDEVHEVDVLTGAFMFLSRNILDQIKGFDEDYFMYGEDIEMSYQIRQLGKKIVYLPHTSIIHFKGESTKKNSIPYLKNFYGAMSIYASKRHSGKGWMWSLILNIGIIFTALAAVSKSILQKILRPLLDLSILFGASKLLQLLWGHFYYNNANYYDDAPVVFSALLSITAIVSIYYLFGHYDKKYKFNQLVINFIFSVFVVLSIYAIYPLEWRYSRIVLVGLTLFTPFVLFFTRCCYHKLLYGKWKFNVEGERRIAIVGSEDSYSRITDVINSLGENSQLLGRIFNKEFSTTSLGSLENLNKIVESRDLNELIFCTKDIQVEKIFSTIAQLNQDISFKIASDDNSSILGSNSKDRVGEWYTLNINLKINQKVHRRIKRLVDLGASFFLFLLFPIAIFFIQNKGKVFSSIFSVFLNNKTWIGFDVTDSKISKLPLLKRGIFSFNEWKKNDSLDAHQNNIFYARNYNVWTEVEQIFKNLFSKD